MAKKKKKQKKSGRKHGLRNVVIVLIVLCVIGAAMSGGNNEDESKTEVSTTVSTETEEFHIYDDAEIVDMINGIGTDKIGEVSVIRAESNGVTIDVLEDWYFNYVVDAEYNYYIIAYTDTEEMGCYAITGLVEKNVVLIEDEYGCYTYKDGDSAIYYLPTNNELTEIIDESESESESAVDNP